MNNAWIVGALMAAAASLPGQATAHPASAHRAGAVHAAIATGNVPAMPRFRFENFTTANGLPDDHVFSVLVDGDRVWAGTNNGLAVLENGKWKTYTTADGLAHRGYIAGARQAQRRCVGGHDGRAEPHLRRAH
jgi:hypothetical protein